MLLSIPVVSPLIISSFRGTSSKATSHDAPYFGNQSPCGWVLCICILGMRGHLPYPVLGSHHLQTVVDPTQDSENIDVIDRNGNDCPRKKTQPWEVAANGHSH